MPENLNLTAALKERLNNESEIIQQAVAQELAIMRTELNATLRRELHTMQKDIEAQSTSVAWTLIKRRFFAPLFIGASLFIGISCGSWAMVEHYSTQIPQLQETVSDLKQQGGKIQFTYCGEKKRLCALIDLKAPAYGQESQYRILEGY